MSVMYKANVRHPPQQESFMEEEMRERWMQLCDLASTEQDPRMLLELTVRINLLLEERRARLTKLAATSTSR